MSRLTPANEARARELMALYPVARSALIPVLHLLQAQDGYLSEDGMIHVGELFGLEPAEVRGTATFYDMLHVEPVGRYVVAVCTNIACQLNGAYELLHHAEERLGVAPGGTTSDGLFTLEDTECLGLCGAAPCLAVNWRYFGDVDKAGFDGLVESLSAGLLEAEVPPHGTLCRVVRKRGLEAGDAPTPGATPAAGATPGDTPGRAPSRGETPVAAAPPTTPQDVFLGTHATTSAVAALNGGRTEESPAGPTGAPRIVTSRLRTPNSWKLSTYLANGGYQGLRKALSMGPSAILDQVNAANILGRGGAGFEAGKKWGMRRQGQPTYLAINGDESEPCTFKDHMLIEADPHAILEGSLICAFTIGASEIFIYIRGEFALGMERMEAAVEEAYAYGALGRNVFGTGWSIDAVVHPGAGAYICGDETGLLESLEGKRGYPRIKPPYFPAVMGLYGAPTIVNNVETVANLPWVILNGGAAFAALGENRSKGTKIMALSGHVMRPGNYEVEFAKVTFRDLIFNPQLGAGIRDGNQLKAFIPGGASSPWLGPEHLDVLLANEEIAKVGTMAGSASVIPMDHTTCMVRVSWRIVSFFHKESCGQCTPCREGAGWLAKVLARIEAGHGREGDLETLMDACDNISPGLRWPPAQTTICPLGPSIPPPVYSAIRMFRDEFMAHIRDGGCSFPPDRLPGAVPVG